MQEVKGYYFKCGKGLISGIKLPDEVKETHFISCMFHPNTFDIKYSSCIFEDCDVYEEDLTNAKDCIFN